MASSQRGPGFRVETDLQHYKRSRKRTDRQQVEHAGPALDSRGVSSNSRQVQEFRGIG